MYADNTFVFPIVRRDFILPALESLRRTTQGHTVVVVNQTQYDAGFERELWNLADLVIRCTKNYGFAQSTNLGTRLATTKWVTVSNDDVVFFWPGYWDGIMETFDKFPTAVGVAPQSPKEPGWGYGEPGYRMHATLEECLADPQGVAERLIAEWHGSVIDGVPAWCVTFKRKEWMELGMFDEHFGLGGGEDYDALCRAYQSGYRVLGSSYSFVWHHWGQSKDRPDGLSQALPAARPPWNKLSTKGFGAEGLWNPDCDVWGHGCTRTDPNVWRAPL